MPRRWSWPGKPSPAPGSRLTRHVRFRESPKTWSKPGSQNDDGTDPCTRRRRCTPGARATPAATVLGDDRSRNEVPRGGPVLVQEAGGGEAVFDRYNPSRRSVALDAATKTPAPDARGASPRAKEAAGRQRSSLSGTSAVVGRRAPAAYPRRVGADRGRDIADAPPASRRRRLRGHSSDGRLPVGRMPDASLHRHRRIFGVAQD